MRTLALNTYAGSLLLGAQACGVEIIGSYEDKGFGQGIAKKNFPHVNHIKYQKDWPKQDLSEVFVIAHPPCSAFSVQNCQPTARGSDSAAFSCTKHVLDYAMGNGAVGVAIESVMGALAGAWHVHQQYADENGYHLYRILENGCMWGCQWRERFWAVWIKKGAVPQDTLQLRLTPRFSVVGDVIRGHEDGPAAGNQDVLLERQKERLIREANLSEADMAYLFNPPPHHPTKALGTVLYEYKFKTPESTSEDKWDVFQKYIGGFASGTMVFLDPVGLSPTLMGGSHWYIYGRNLSENGFKRIMGFPVTYEFPGDVQVGFRTQMRMYLSKGVMPPIAQWILENVTAHLGWTGQQNKQHDPTLPTYELAVEPNNIADFRIKKSDWYERDKQLPPLRHHEEFGEPKPRRSAVVTPFIPRPSKERPVRPPRENVAVPRGKLSDVKIALAEEFELTPNVGSLIEQKRHKILEVIKGLGTVTHHQAIEECCKHPDLQVLPTTMHWHIRQLVKGGQLREVNE